MPAENFITATCVINQGAIYKNGLSLFSNRDADLPGFLLAAYQHFEIKYPKFYKMDNLSKLGWITTELLLKESWNAGEYDALDLGLVLANSSSSLDTDIKYFETTKEIASPALFVYTLPNIMIGEICIRHHFKGESSFFIFDKFDPAFFERNVNYLLNNNILQACICGWVELLGDSYKVVLFLVEKKTDQKQVLFTEENINKTYQLENG